jgi:hypothetical protein
MYESVAHGNYRHMANAKREQFFQAFRIPSNIDNAMRDTTLGQEFFCAQATRATRLHKDSIARVGIGDLLRAHHFTLGVSHDRVAISILGRPALREIACVDFK